MRTSLFEGWTREQQCFGPLEDGVGRYCAIGWLLRCRASHDELRRIYRAVGDALIERFPEIIKVKGGFRIQIPRWPIIYANDHLKLDPEVFLSLDRESIAREEAREAMEMQEQAIQ